MKPTHTKPRSVRVPDELWDAVVDKTVAEGKTVTDVILAALTRYLKTASK